MENNKNCCELMGLLTLVLIWFLIGFVVASTFTISLLIKIVSCYIGIFWVLPIIWSLLAKVFNIWCKITEFLFDG